MELPKYVTCLWPGLSELWLRGRLSALPLAIGFAIGFNALLVLKYLYPTWLDPLLVRSAWWVGLAAWVCLTAKSVRSLPGLLHPRECSEQVDHYGEAHQAYLRADWKSAERLLLGILAIDPRDPPALLLLSGVYRHTDRLDHALALLAQLEKLEIGAGWQIEIEIEMARIERQRDADQADAATATGAPTAPSDAAQSDTPPDCQPTEISGDAADLTAA